jgi:hypothetical protein
MKLERRGMTQEELIEKLADKEHASWARWMAYLFTKCEDNPDGSLTIPSAYVTSLQSQVDTSYADLYEREKQYDRDEVAHILPIINEHVNDKLTNVVVKTISHGGIMNPLRKPLQGN